MMKWFLFFIVTLLSVGCANKKSSNQEIPEDIKAKDLLQGIWIDSDNDIPLMYVKGDTIYHSEPQNAPVYFKIVKDSLYLLGYNTSSYQIERQSAYTFWFYTLSGNIIKLHKSENPNDSIAFSRKNDVIIPVYSEVAQKDSVVFYNNMRYRAYVYINPSTTKVFKTVYSDEGLGVDNIYYDNVIHICVYKGTEKLYAKDITKQMFSKIISEEFLADAILADMNFISVGSTGFLYQANICVPESYVYQAANLTIGFDGNLNINTPEQQELFAEIK